MILKRLRNTVLDINNLSPKSISFIKCQDFFPNEGEWLEFMPLKILLRLEKPEAKNCVRLSLLPRPVVLNLFELAAHYFVKKFGGTPKCKK
jgi:hypothetical protein